MKTNITQILLPTIVFGGFILTSGCSTPTASIGATARSDRAVLTVRSPVATKVQCVWEQDGSRIRYEHATPFRLALPGSAVSEISLSKPVEGARVEVKVRPAGAEPSRFVMERGCTGLKLVRDMRHWEGRIFSGRGAGSPP